MVKGAFESDRVKTGIYGLDELLEGGFPRGRTVLVTGACGTGKSIFCMQYLFNGAAEYKEPGVYVTFDEVPEKLRQDMLSFGWSLKELEEKNLLALIDATSGRAGAPSSEEHAILPGQLDFDKVLIEILEVTKKIGAKRLVIDSIPALAFQLEREQDVRKMLLKLGYVLSRAGLTTIITSEIAEQAIGGGGAIEFSKYGVEEFVSDGVILMNFLGIGSQTTRTMYVRKLRGTKHSLEIHPMQITEKGIVVKKVEDVFK